MSAELLAVEGCTFTTDISGYTVTVLPPPASTVCDKVKCGGNKVYKIISFTVTNGTYTGAGIITGSTTKVKGNAIALVRKGDNVTVTCVQPPPATATQDVKVTVDGAGQLKVKAI